MTRYKITGILRNGKRFRTIYTDSLSYAMGINLWNGNVWQDVNGKWKNIRRVYN